MPTLSNEHLCKLAQAGDTTARDILLKSNLGFIRKIALEQYRSMGLDENDIGIDVDDLVQEGSIGLLNAIPLFDAGRGMKFLTYGNRSIIPRYRKVVVPGTHTAENHDFISSDPWSRSSISKSLRCTARWGNMLSR